MSVSYGFFNASGHDRVYDADDFGRLFDGIITDGVFEGVGDEFAVTPVEGSMAVLVGTGRAWFNRTWTRNDALYPLQITTAPQVGSRIDAIVLEVNKNIDVRNNTIKVLTGEPSTDPKKPTLQRSDDIYQYALAYVTVPTDVTTSADFIIEGAVNAGGDQPTPYVTGEVNQLDPKSIAAQFENEFNNYFAAWEKEQEALFNTFKAKIYNELSDSQIGALQALVESKEDAPVVLSKTLTAGSTLLEFQDKNIKDGCLIDPYADDYGVILLNMTQNGNNVGLTFKAHSKDINVKLMVRN